MVTVGTCIFVKLLVFLWHLFQSFLVLDPTWTVIELCGGGRGERGREEEGEEEGEGGGVGGKRKRRGGKREGKEREKKGRGRREEGGGRRKSATDEQLAVTYKG